MFKSIGGRYIIVALLTALMTIPLFFVSEVIKDRKREANFARHEITKQWGGRQHLYGPYLEIPVFETVTEEAKQRSIDPVTGRETFSIVAKPVDQPRAPAYLLPTKLDHDFTLSTELRRRGIFQVPVYSLAGALNAGFDTTRLQDVLGENERLDWENARLNLGVSGRHGLTGDTALTIGEQQYRLQPMDDGEGVFAVIGDPRKMSDAIVTLGLKGAESLSFAPTGDLTTAKIAGNWPHPGFDGARLPDAYDTSDTGFAATWEIPYFSRDIASVGRGTVSTVLSEQAIRVKLVEVADFYQKAFRAGRYGVLFIALTFLTVLLLEKRDRATHPVQYLFIGLAQSLFILMMVAYAEQMGFARAYLLSAGAVIAVITGFGWLALKQGLRSLWLGAALTGIYAVLYTILKSEDTAFAMGATLAFAALALTMFATRNVEWTRARTEPDAAAPA